MDLVEVLPKNQLVDELAVVGRLLGIILLRSLLPPDWRRHRR
jgi:hypothetical protein